MKLTLANLKTQILFFCLCFRNLYDDLVSKNLLKPFQYSKTENESITNFVAPKGNSSVVKYFFEKSGIKPKFLHHVSQVEITPDSKIQVSTQVRLLYQF